MQYSRNIGVNTGHILHFSSIQEFRERIKKYNECLFNNKLFLYLQTCSVRRANWTLHTTIISINKSPCTGASTLVFR